MRIINEVGSGIFKIAILTTAILFIISRSVASQEMSTSQDTSQVKAKSIKIQPDSLMSDSTTLDSTQFNVIQDSSEKMLREILRDYSDLDLSIVIQDGKQYTKKREVVLELKAPEAVDMIIGNSAVLDDGLWEPFQHKVNWQLAPGDGYQMVYFRVRYPDSSLSRIVYDEIILDSKPPIPKFVVTPDTGIAEETLFTFDATASSHNFELFLRWDWDGDGQFDTDWTVSKESAHTYPVGGGKKTVRLEVKDSGGWVASVTRDIVVYSRPDAAFLYSQDFEQPLKITLDGSVSNDFEDKNNLWYRWNTNSDSTWDYAWSRQKKRVHEFQPFEQTVVTLEVRDSQNLTDTYELVLVNEFRDMVYVPAGEFVMGSENYEIDERPKHTVSIDAFWIDKYPVTNEKFAIFLNEYFIKFPDEKSSASRIIDLSSGEDGIVFLDNQYVVNEQFKNHPVVNVTWYGADAYAKFYNKRLPTEAEWEKAARGNDERLYPWGNEISGENANYWDSGDPFDNGTTPVGYYDGTDHNGYKTTDSHSFYGAYDMVGNVREWVVDWYQRDYYSVTPGINPFGPETGLKKVVRGGGFLFHYDDLRASYRYSLPPDKGTNYIGFRCVKSK